MAIFWIVYWSARIIIRTVLKLNILGLENIPRTGAVLILVNHISGWDPPVAGTVVPRASYFMAKKELFHNKFAGWFLGKLQAFPVDRSRPDRAAIRYALDVLNRGHALLMFPEGHRSESGELQEARAGAAFLAQKTQCLVVPIGIRGEYRLRSEITYNIGKPFTIGREITRKEAQELITQKIREQIGGA